MRRVALRVDVSHSVGAEDGVSTSVLVCLPDAADLPTRPVVMFCWPGGGYSKAYYDIHGPGLAGYSQAEFHTRQGAIVVACDHVGVGESSEYDRSHLSHENVAAANRATVLHVVHLLSAGGLEPGFPQVKEPILVGVGHSFGGELLIVQQGRQRTFDAIAVLGYSAIRSHLPAPAEGGVSATGGAVRPVAEMTKREVQGYAFHWEDVPAHIYQEDMKGEHPTREAPLPMWASDRRPGGVHWHHNPGVVAHWANVIECPVFLGYGERDSSADPHADVAAYRRSRDVTLYIGTRMAHIHNLSGPRRVLWRRLASWLDGLPRAQG